MNVIHILSAEIICNLVFGKVLTKL